MPRESDENGGKAMLCRHSSPGHFDGPGDKIGAVSAKPTNPHQRIRPEAFFHQLPVAEIAALALAENQLSDRADVSAFDYGLWQISDGILRGARTIPKETEIVEGALQARLILSNGDVASERYRTAFSWQFALRFANRLQKQALARFFDSGNELAAELKVEKGSEAA